MTTPGNPGRARRGRGKRLHWHSYAHRAWGKERLYFWRLRFRPTYPIADVRRELQQLFCDARVGSYMVYEVFGESDLLIRLWLPATLPAGDFSELLWERLRDFDLDNEDNLEVDGVLRHWVWGNGEPDTPSESRMEASPPSDEEILAVNGGQPTHELLRRLRGEHLVTDVRPADGIKFAMIVTTPVKELSRDERRQAQRRLKEIIDDADRVDERSLYHGHGLGAFVILGRVKHRDFDAIRDQLAEPIARDLGAEWIGARTYTMIVASWEFLPFRDELPLARELQDEEIGIDEALAQPEGMRVEVKASAFVDYDTFLRTNGQRVKDRVVTHSFLRALTGLLNSEGGTIVVGAYEVDRLNGARAAVAHLPRRGEYVCTGVEHEWPRGRSSGWDKYERQLVEAIKRHVSPLATTWVRIIPERIESATLARVVVHRPDDQWYYLDGFDAERREFTRRLDFWVRVGNSTMSLEGPGADEYKRINRRR